MKTPHSSAESSCSPTLHRRCFLASGTAAVAAAELDLFGFARSLLAAESATAEKPRKKPLIRVVFVRPKTSDPEKLGERPVISWPGGQFDIKAGEALNRKVLTEAAKKLDVQLEIRPEPLAGDEAVDAYAEELKKTPPDGLFIVANELFRWKWVNRLLTKRGDLPTVVYSPMGSSFTKMLKFARKQPRTFVASTQDVKWPAFGLRMLATVRRMADTRICILRGSKTQDRKLPGLGTTLHYVPLARFEEELKKIETTAEVKAMAEHYAKNAKEIIEPKPKEILDAAKNYFALRRIMAAEKCQGISIDCLKKKSIYFKTVCIAMSRLLDEGVVAACEADWKAAIGMQLTHLLFERPGFMQDPVPNTVNNTLMGAHCMSATKLDGFAKPYCAPYVLRSYHTRTGAAMQVLWRLGQKVTVMQFVKSQKMILGSGRVVANIEQPPAGCCRTAVEIKLDGMPDTGDTKGFHQLFIYGNLERKFKAYCRLAGIEVEHI